MIPLAVQAALLHLTDHVCEVAGQVQSLSVLRTDTFAARAWLVSEVAHATTDAVAMMGTK